MTQLIQNLRNNRRNISVKKAFFTNVKINKEAKDNNNYKRVCVYINLRDCNFFLLNSYKNLQIRMTYYILAWYWIKVYETLGDKLSIRLLSHF